MSKSIILLLSLVCGLLSTVQAQKIKYKDIFPLLEAKDYDNAIPQLESFLLDSKTTDHANANFQMALYYEYQVSNFHLIKDSTDILRAAENALVYLTKAKKLITEKDLKKNSDYYKSYERRDLRTGDFGIKISDVQLDVENKTKSITGIINEGSQIYENLAATNELNKFSQETYKSFVETYGTANEFCLRASDDQLDLLEKMMDAKADIDDNFKEVRNAVSKIDSKGYSPEIEFIPVTKFGVDGVGDVNFFINDIVAWDYGTWASSMYDKIDGEISVLHKELVALDKKLKEQSESMNGLSNVSYNELIHTVDPKLVEQLNQYDEDPIPLKLFSSMIKTNEFKFITKPIQNPKIEDVNDIDYQLLIADSLVSILEEIEKGVEVLVEPAVTEANSRYYPLVNGQYGGDFGLIKYRKNVESFLDKSANKWRQKKEYFTQKSVWAINRAEADSIYLLSELDESYQVPMYDKFYTISSNRADTTNIYVIGLEFTGSSDKGFVAAVSNKREVLWKTNFSLKGFSVGGSKSAVVGKFVPSQSGAMTAYIYTHNPQTSQNLIALSFDVGNGEMKWVNPKKVENRPIDVKFNTLVKETIFYLKTEEELEDATSEDLGYFVIDRSGVIR